MGMLRTLDEIKNMEIEAGVVVNGVDNANLMSVDSTEPLKSNPDNEKVSEEDIDIDISASKDESKNVEKKTETSKKGKEFDEKLTESAEKKEGEDESEAGDFTDEKDSKPVKQRIGTLTKKWRTAERERDFEREKRIEVEAKLKEISSKISVDSSKPQKEDFEDEDDYIEALTDWKIDSKLKNSQKEVEKEVKDERERMVVSETYNGLDNAMESGREKYPDFDELVLDENLVISPEVTQILLDSDAPEDVMYYLATNPEDSERISKLGTIQAAREIGKIETKLAKVEDKEKEKPKPAKKQSNAPAPITPVRTDGVTEKDPNKMSPAEYKAWRMKK
jgi:hypothetical protein